MRITSHIQDPGLQDRFLEVEKELHRQRFIFDKPEGDVRLARFCEASLRLINDEPMRPVVEDYLVVNPTDSPSYSVNKLLRAPQKQMLFNNLELDYPKDGFDQVEPWLRELRRIFNGDEPYDIGTLYLDLFSRPAAANVSERYKSADLIFGIMKDYLPDNPKVWDVGCSLNHGLRRIKRQAELPFEKFDVNKSLAFNQHFEIRLDDPVRAEHLYKKLGQVSLGPSLGIDIINYYRKVKRDNKTLLVVDSEPQKWAHSCSSYPTEFLDEKRMADFAKLEENVEGVDFINADFSLPIKELKEMLPKDKPDVIIFSTVLYQSPEKAKSMIRNAEDFLSDNGAILILDFLEVDEEDPHSFTHINSWFSKPYPYRALVKLKQYPNEGYFEVFRWNNGRCKSLLEGKDYDRFLNVLGVQE